MIRRSSKFAMLGGVCSGYAISEKLPVALVRSFAAILLFYTVGGAALLYLAAWILMPAPAEGAAEHLPAEEKLVRKKSNQVIGGVCGAFASYFKVDPTLVRILAVISVFVVGTGLFLYVFAWAIIPEEKL